MHLPNAGKAADKQGHWQKQLFFPGEAQVKRFCLASWLLPFLLGGFESYKQS